MLDLSIVLITYNRAAYLRRTLTALSQSVFKDCDLWLLNNASTDETLAVCQEFQASLPNLHVVTHRYNIGGNPNILRAYEYGNRYYTWHLCDDDELHLDQVTDLVQALEKKECDLIRVYGGMPEERGHASTLGDLLRDPNSFTFYSLGFVPALIFRQDALEAGVQSGYKHLATMYAQLFVLFKAFSLDARIYTTQQELLKRGDAPMSIGSEILLYQIQSLPAIPDKRARAIAIAWRPKRQKLLGYIFGYARLILADLRFGRSRRSIFSTWVKTIWAVPSLISKVIILLNGLFILTPIGPIYYLIRKRKMDARTYPHRGDI